MANATTLFASLARSVERRASRLPTPAGWHRDPVLGPFATIADVLEATGTARRAAERRPVLAALLRLADGDHLASEVLLAALVPALRSVAAELSRWPGVEADEVDALVAAGAWEALCALRGSLQPWPDRIVVGRARDFARARLRAQSCRGARELRCPNGLELAGQDDDGFGTVLARAALEHRRAWPARVATGTPRLGSSGRRPHACRARAPRRHRARGGFDGAAQGGAGAAARAHWGGGVMLSVAGISSEGYYLKDVLRHIDEYYTGGEAEGHGVGTGPEALGLEGNVVAEDLRALLGGLSPGDGKPMYSAHAAARRSRAGFDLTFSAPKGVSLLALLSGSELREKVIAVHETAVGEALGYLEAEAAFVRRGKDGLVRLRAEGFIGAAFLHTTSRLGDPQLHTHLVTAHICFGCPGSCWRPAAAAFRAPRTPLP